MHRNSPSVDESMSRDADVDIGHIFTRIWAFKFHILVVSLLAAVLAFLIVQGLVPRYRSDASILIRSSGTLLTQNPGTQVNAQTDLDPLGIASQVQLLRSRRIAKSVIDKLKLAEIAEFNPRKQTASRGVFSSLKRVFSSILSSGGGGPVIEDDLVMKSYFEHLSVYQQDKTRVVTVSFWSADPKLSADVANAIADEYLTLQEEFKRGAGPGALDKLEPELKALRDGVVSAEAAVADFRASSDLFETSGKTPLLTQELTELTAELGRAKTARANAEVKAQSVSRALQSGSLDASSSILESTLIERLRESQINLNGQLSVLSTTLLPQHPRIKSIQSQVYNLDQQIRREAQKIEKSLRETVRTERKRENDLVQQRNVLKAKVAIAEKKGVELRALEREASAQRQLLNQYLVRFKEAKSRQNRKFLPADAFVFSRAQVPSDPYFPKKGPILLGSFFGTLVLSSMFVIAGSLLVGPPTNAQVGHGQAVAIQQPISVAATQQLPMPQAVVPQNPVLQAPVPQAPVPQTHFPQPVSTVAAVPAASYSPAAPVAGSTVTLPAAQFAPPQAPQSAPAHHMQLNAPSIAMGADVSSPTPVNFRTAAQLASSATVTARSLSLMGPSRSVVASPERQAKSQGVVVLARLMATQGASVIVLDMSGQGHSSQTMLNNINANGIRDVLTGSCAFANAIHRDWGSTAHVMPVGNSPVTTVSQNAGRLPTILSALQQAYDHVIVDCGSADVHTLVKVSTEESFNIVFAQDVNSAEVENFTSRMQSEGLGAPLVLTLNGNEQSLLSPAVA